MKFPKSADTISKTELRWSVRLDQTRAPIEHPRPIVEWMARATALDGGTCPKCRGVTRGKYLMAALGECGIMEQCWACGWERVVERGLGGVPVGPETL